MNDDHEARVRAAAYRRWEDEGRPEGRATAHWLEAERTLNDEGAAPHSQQGISNRPQDEEAGEQAELPPRFTRKRASGTQTAPDEPDRA